MAHGMASRHLLVGKGSSLLTYCIRRIYIILNKNEMAQICTALYPATRVVKVSVLQSGFVGVVFICTTNSTKGSCSPRGVASCSFDLIYPFLRPSMLRQLICLMILRKLIVHFIGWFSRRLPLHTGPAFLRCLRSPLEIQIHL